MTILKGVATMGLVLGAGLVGTVMTASTAYAFPVQCQAQGKNLAPNCGEDPPGGGGGGGGGTTTPPPPPPPTYTLQGVIQNEGYEGDPHVPHGARVRLRAYSRFANANNDRVDASYINVRCNAYDQLGGYTTDYDSENNGALVDVHFSSNFVYGSYRTITVNCVHHAEFRGVNYDVNSTTQINIPY